MLTLIVGLILSVFVLGIWCLDLAYTIAEVEKSLVDDVNAVLKADNFHYQNVQEHINYVDNKLIDRILDLNNIHQDLAEEVRKNKDLFQDLMIEQNCNFTKYVDEQINKLKNNNKSKRKTSKR